MADCLGLEITGEHLTVVYLEIKNITFTCSQLWRFLWGFCLTTCKCDVFVVKNSMCCMLHTFVHDVQHAHMLAHFISMCIDVQLRAMSWCRVTYIIVWISNTGADINSLQTELPVYLAAVEDTSQSVVPTKWWEMHQELIPHSTERSLLCHQLQQQSECSQS